jgi:polar amino acid transport system substrate-binding protein
MRKLLVLLLALLMLAAAGCGGDDEESADGTGGTADTTQTVPTNLTLKTDGQLTVAAEFPSGKFLIPPSSNPTGLEVDIASEIAKRLGIPKVVWQERPFTTLFAPGEKPFDMAINEISITEERDQAVDFSSPYYEADQALLVRKGGPGADAQSLADVQKLRLGVQATTTGFFYVKDNIKPTQDPRVYDTLPAAKQALLNGQYDAMVMDVPIVADIVANENPDELEIAGKFTTGEEWGILFEEGNTLRDEVNRVLQEMVDDGTIDEIREKWLPGSTQDLRDLSK